MLLYNAVTALLMVLMVRCAFTLVDHPLRRVPWVAVALTGLVVAGIVLETVWSGALDALDSDPSRAGWWRPFTSVFMQNSGVSGDVWNVLSLAFIAAYASWRWGGPLTVALFAAGALLPEVLDLVLGTGGRSTDPRNFAGSSGATYFLGATLAAALLFAGRTWQARLLALAVPAVGLLTWFVQANAHGLVTTEGFALGVIVSLVRIAVARGAARPCPDGSTSGTA